MAATEDKLSERIIDIVFYDPEIIKLQERALIEIVTFGEVSEITKAYAEQRIREIMESWEQ